MREAPAIRLPGVRWVPTLRDVLAVGLGVKDGVLRSVAVSDSGEQRGVVQFASTHLPAGAAVTPHVEFMRASLDQLSRVLDSCGQVLGAWLDREVKCRVEDARTLGEVGVIAVVAPRCPRVEGLRSRVKRRSYAACADEHLVAEALRASAEALSPSVVAMSATEALERARLYFALDRQALGSAAKDAQPRLGQDFEYAHRLPTLVAHVALAAVQRGEAI